MDLTAPYDRLLRHKTMIRADLTGNRGRLCGLPDQQAPDQDIRPDDAPSTAPRRPMVVPFARAITLLAAYTPQDCWLGNSELATRTELPASTVTRLAHTLVSLGYLLHEPCQRKYRLSASVLALGYAAFANSAVQRLARAQMQNFAERQSTHVVLSSRYRLDLIVLESFCCPGSPMPPDLQIGARGSMGASPMGWALLAALSEAERYYLLSNIERRMPREWMRLRRRTSEGVAQIYDRGYCSSPGDQCGGPWTVAVPVMIRGREPQVLACVASATKISRVQIDRELGPRLVGMAHFLEQAEE